MTDRRQPTLYAAGGYGKRIHSATPDQQGAASDSENTMVQDGQCWRDGPARGPCRRVIRQNDCGVAKPIPLLSGSQNINISPSSVPTDLELLRLTAMTVLRFATEGRALKMLTQRYCASY